jgi:hypothetical protein
MYAPINELRSIRWQRNLHVLRSKKKNNKVKKVAKATKKNDAGERESAKNNLLCPSQRKDTGVDKSMDKKGRCNFAPYFFLPNSARNRISACSRNDLKISDFYLNSLLDLEIYMYATET